MAFPSDDGTEDIKGYLDPRIRGRTIAAEAGFLFGLGGVVRLPILFVGDLLGFGDRNSAVGADFLFQGVRDVEYVFALLAPQFEVGASTARRVAVYIGRLVNRGNRAPHVSASY